MRQRTASTAAPGIAPGIRLLICEDSEDDALLIVRRLRRDGLAAAYERVETAEDAALALRLRPPDLIVSDYFIPGFGAESALRVLRASGLDVPFIVVSGRIGEESAAELMRAGAHDVVLKDRLSRLAPAVRRELEQAADRAERRAAEAALRRSEQRFRLFADHSPDVMFRFRIHPADEVEYLSPAAGAVLGRAPEQLCGDPGPLFALVAPEDRLPLAATWHAADTQPLVVRWCRPDGTEAWTEQRAVTRRDESGRVVAVEGVLREISDRMRADALRDRLRQAERLDSLGRLVGGIAHDFNNLLAVILGNTDLALAELPGDSPHRPGMELIRDLAAGGADLTRQLLAFSRHEPPRPEVLDANEVIADTERVLRRAIGEDVEIRTRLDPGLRPVAIDRSELERLLLNLLANARRAMPHGGRLVVETDNVDIPKKPDKPGAPGTPTTPPGTGTGGTKDAPGAHLTPGPAIRLRVIDTGVGMSETVREHAFEPYYTAGAGDGTGLGLSSAYGVVKAAGGEIRIDSRPGAGTVVSVYLPAAVGPAEPAAVPAPAPPSGQGRTLLVVEDDGAVREMVGTMVRRHGYHAICTASPADALSVVEQSDRRIDALLTDLVMAGMSGIELAEAARARVPDLPVLVMSGYSAGAASADGVLPAGLSLIRKPFTAATLLRALAEVLGIEPPDPN
ncbi:two-component system cell cycle sensor histidine kinase/response regulator CckA [Catenulispora sp. GAS73]|uniref:response regulator n=1 Tax=Catenulispora sp. GAS73 TaxID=3156269 RepID=UPI0035152392